MYPLDELSGHPCCRGRAAGPTVGALSQAALGCRAAQVLMQYCILANHYWFLVEAVYLYKLLIGAVFSEKNYYRLYLYLGWGRGHPGVRGGVSGTVHCVGNHCGPNWLREGVGWGLR